jgi:hypothetical protein
VIHPQDAIARLLDVGRIVTSLELLGPTRSMPLAEYRTRTWERKGMERVGTPAVGTIEAALTKLGL